MGAHSASRTPGRRRWLAVSVAALAGAAVCTAYAAGWLGAADGSTAVDDPPTVGASAPSAPTPAPSSARTSTRAAPMSFSAPVRLRIPGIGVDSRLMSLGLLPDGTLETPPGAFPAGWFTGAPAPGELGPAIIVGHVRFGGPGVFARLPELRRGDEIEVLRADGRAADFRVTRTETVEKSSFPTDEVYGDLRHAGLRLITCGGLDATTDEFEENVIVFAELVDS